MPHKNVKLPIFARVRAFLGLIVMAIVSIYQPRNTYIIASLVDEAIKRNKKRDQWLNDAEGQYNILHVYGQESIGGDVIIGGSTASLLALHDAITDCLNDTSGVLRFEASDGVSYRLQIIKSDHPQFWLAPYETEPSSVYKNEETFRPTIDE